MVEQETHPRGVLLGLLRTDDAVDRMCSEALRSEVGLLSWSNEHAAETVSLSRIYERRAGHLEDRGIRQIGAHDFAQALRTAPVEGVVLAGIHTPQWNFFVAVAADLSGVIASMAVDAGVANQDWDYATSHRY